jgi:hypothetical protein
VLLLRLWLQPLQPPQVLLLHLLQALLHLMQPSWRACNLVACDKTDQWGEQGLHRPLLLCFLMRKLRACVAAASRLIATIGVVSAASMNLQNLNMGTAQSETACDGELTD